CGDSPRSARAALVFFDRFSASGGKPVAGHDRAVATGQGGMEVSLSDSRPVSFERGVRRAGWAEGKQNFSSHNPREQTEMVFSRDIYCGAFCCGRPRGKNLHEKCA